MNTSKQINFKQLLRRQRGIAMVEFVIGAPVVLFIALVVAEMGYAIMQFNNLNQGVRNGARHLAQIAIPSGTAILITGDTTTQVQNMVVYGSPAGGTKSVVPGLTITDVTITEIDFQDVRVDATYTYQPLLFSAIPTVYSRNGGTIANFLTMNSQIVVRAMKADG